MPGIRIYVFLLVYLLYGLKVFGEKNDLTRLCFAFERNVLHGEEVNGYPLMG